MLTVCWAKRQEKKTNHGNTRKKLIGIMDNVKTCIQLYNNIIYNCIYFH